MAGPAITLPVVGADNGTWGAILNAALNAINDRDVFALKTADEPLTTSTTLQDDDHLVGLALSAGTWVVTAQCLVSGPAAADVKIAWSFSGTASASYRWGQGPSTSTTWVANGSAVRAAASGDTSTGITNATPYGTDGTNWSAIQDSGVMVVTVAGTLKLQWAQNASSGTTIMRAGSYMLARRVA